MSPTVKAVLDIMPAPLAIPLPFPFRNWKRHLYGKWTGWLLRLGATSRRWQIGLVRAAGRGRGQLDRIAGMAYRWVDVDAPPGTHSTSLSAPRAQPTQAAAEPHPVLTALDRIPRPRLGYLGDVTADMVDLALVCAVAKARPGWSVVLVGSRNQRDARGRLGGVSLPRNVHVLHAVPDALTPAVIDRFDVALLPCADELVMQATFGPKLFDYMRQGRPVVSPTLPALAPFRRWIREADSADEWILEIHAALGEHSRAAEARRAAAQTFGCDGEAVVQQMREAS